MTCCPSCQVEWGGDGGCPECGDPGWPGTLERLCPHLIPDGGPPTLACEVCAGSWYRELARVLEVASPPAIL